VSVTAYLFISNPKDYLWKGTRSTLRYFKFDL